MNERTLWSKLVRWRSSLVHGVPIPEFKEPPAASSEPPTKPTAPSWLGRLVLAAALAGSGWTAGQWFQTPPPANQAVQQLEPSPPAQQAAL